MNWRMYNMKTIREVYCDRIENTHTQEDADRFWKEMLKDQRELTPNLTSDEEIIAITKSNLGYVIGAYMGLEYRTKMYKLYKVSHPLGLT